MAIKMNKCILCKREYDPSMEFCENIEMLEVLVRYIDIEKICPECCEKVDNNISMIVNEIKGF